MIKECACCSKEFTAKGRQEKIKKFCCQGCGKQYARKIGNPEKHLETTRIYNEKIKNDPARKKRRACQYKKYWQTQKGRFCHYKAGAVSRDLEFSLSFDEFVSLWDQECYYCGEKIEGIGIDRVDNNIGYLIKNCVPCCITCNNMKKTMTEEEFIDQCAKIINNLSLDDAESSTGEA